MKKYLILILILVLVSGCYSKEDKKLAKQYKEQAKINALDYVKEKYGIEAKVKSVKEEVECNNSWKCINSNPSGNVTVKLNYDKKDFIVFVTGKKKTTNALDNYQFNEIEESLINYFKNNINLELYDYKIKYNTPYIQEKYDNNLNDMAKYIDKIELYYIGDYNLDINTSSIESFLQVYNGTFNLIDFKTKELCDTYKKIEIENNSYLMIYKYNELNINNKQRSFHRYNNITTYNDEVYIYSPTTNNSFEISTGKLDEIKNYKKLYKDLDYKKIKIITNEYSINRPREILYIYFPKEKVSAKENDNVYLAFECYVKGIKKHFISSYFSDNTDIKINNIGLYYMEEENLSICDVNKKINFALIKVSY